VRGARLIGDTVLAVADGGSQQIRFFLRDGELLGVGGRAGAGPAEFSGLSSIHPYRPGTILAWDFRLRKAAVFDDRGNFLDSWRVRGHGDEHLAPVGGAVDGTVFLHSSHPIQPSSPPRVSRPSVALLRLPPHGDNADTVGVFEGPERYHGPGMAVARVRFTTSTVFAVRDESIITANTATTEIKVWDTAGHLRRSVRWTQPSYDVLPRHIAAEKQRLKEDIGPLVLLARSRQMFEDPTEHLTENMPFPTVFPSYAPYPLMSTGTSGWRRINAPATPIPHGSLFTPMVRR